MGERLGHWGDRLDHERRSLVTHGKEAIAVSILLPWVAALICRDVISATDDILRLYQALRSVRDGRPVPEGLLTRMR